MLRETVCSKKGHSNHQAGQKEQSSVPADIQDSSSWMWHPAWHAALTEGNPQVTFLLCSFSYASRGSVKQVSQCQNCGNWQVGKKRVNLAEAYSTFNSRAIQ